MKAKKGHVGKFSFNLVPSSYRILQVWSWLCIFVLFVGINCNRFWNKKNISLLTPVHALPPHQKSLYPNVDLLKRSAVTPPLSALHFWPRVMWSQLFLQGKTMGEPWWPKSNPLTWFSWSFQFGGYFVRGVGRATMPGWTGNPMAVWNKTISYSCDCLWPISGYICCLGHNISQIGLTITARFCIHFEKNKRW